MGIDHVVIVEDVNTFASRYGTGINIAGQYSGKLSNGGERIELQDPVGQTILNFRYSDNWQPLTDGDGLSLEIIDSTNSDPSSWNRGDSWRAGQTLYGSPGE